MKPVAFALVLLTGLGLSGCFTRTINYVEEHPKADSMLIQTTDDSNWLIYRQVKAQYWECNDDGKKVTCKKACEGETDLTCPSAIGNMNNFSSGGQR
jgi:hypothetical protein